MSEYKIEAKDNVFIGSIGVRLSSGETLNIEEPTSSAYEELRKLEKLGDLRLVELQEETVITVDDKDEEVEEDSREEKSLSKTLMEGENKFDCKICEKTHYLDSKIGQEHLEKMLNEEEFEEFKKKD